MECCSRLQKKDGEESRHLASREYTYDAAPSSTRFGDGSFIPMGVIKL